jgi:hypothetical protein
MRAGFALAEAARSGLIMIWPFRSHVPATVRRIVTGWRSIPRLHGRRQVGIQWTICGPPQPSPDRLAFRPTIGVLRSVSDPPKTSYPRKLEKMLATHQVVGDRR